MYYDIPDKVDPNILITGTCLISFPRKSENVTSNSGSGVDW